MSIANDALPSSSLRQATAGIAVPTSPKARSTSARRTVVPAALGWFVVGILTLQWPNKESGFNEWAYTTEFGIACLVLGALLLAASALGRRAGALGRGVGRAGPWLILLAVVFGAWEVATAKLGLLPVPFFAPPQSLIEVYLDDHVRLGDSVVASVKLLGYGFGVGAVTGFLTGVAIGWSRAVGYWVHPVIRFVGPIPASALLPLAFFVFPSSYAAAVFLIALATGFPVAVLTWSGVAGVNKSYYDVARTLGASEWFLVLRVAVPAALPQVFVGLFMGLGASFSILVTAEMMGVKAGLGWYLTWAQGWASYTNMYAALIVMAVVCSSLITLLFVVRDRSLSWQKGTVKW
jgi:NitT/TauT family transport system permease protein